MARGVLPTTDVRRACLAVASILVAFAFVERDARAAESVFVEGALGMGAPLGWAGASVVAVPTPVLAVHAGAGLGSQGPQIAAGLRARVALTPREHLSIGGGWSTGQIAVVGDSAFSALPVMNRKRAPTWFWDRAHMVNLDVSFEHDTGGLILRPFAGLGYVVNDHSARVNATCLGCSPGPFVRVIPYLGFAFAVGIL
jgi:hypothetical protein